MRLPLLSWQADKNILNVREYPSAMVRKCSDYPNGKVIQMEVK